MTTLTQTQLGTELNAERNCDTMFISDNLPFLKALDSESIDLVCIDPPFGKKQTFEGRLKPPLTKEELDAERKLMDSWGVYDAATAYESGLEWPDQSGESAKFSDIWDFPRRVAQDWYQDLEQINPALYLLLESTRYSRNDGDAAYIAFMAERLVEVKRVLKLTGSVYLHCDHDANAYLRQMMDAVFGADNFRNEIVWRSTSAHNSARRWGPIHETILFYSRSPKYKWNRGVRQPYTDDYLEEYYRYEDERGFYERFDLTGSGVRYGHSGQPWRGVNPTDVGRHWAVPRQSLQNAYPDRDDLDDLTTQECLDLLDSAGLVYWPQRGGKPRHKRYADESVGMAVQDVVLDIGNLSAHDIEKTGYPTQKPQALARRIIEASTNRGDIVLDCFAGCAYVPVAAEITGRRWIACDMSPRAWTVIRRQFHKHPDLGIITEGELLDSVEARMENAERVIKVLGPGQLPQRTHEDGEQRPIIKTLPRPRFRQKAVETSETIWQAFVDEWGTGCWYCGTEKAPDRRELHLDHIEPNKGDGTNDDCFNRALSCAPCNSDKSNNLNVEETIDKAFEDGRVQTAARRDEVLRGFKVRHEWAKVRWTRVKPNMLPI